ncbi:peptidase C65 Otubain-domain-containing protein [Astrocystis sublimbata]|nr:peptidase C65 Otubain-domain-containing protein [Astrocystis sublimbata]
MFQPQPTPYLPYSLYPNGIHVANAGLPQYTFESTPLFDQFGGGRVEGSAGGGSNDAGVVGGRAGAATAGSCAATNSNNINSNNSNSNFHGDSGGGRGAPAGLGAGVQGQVQPGGAQGLGPPGTVAASNACSGGYSSSASATSLHPCLYNIPMPVSVPRHHLVHRRRPQQQHQQHQNQQHHQHQQHQHQHHTQQQPQPPPAQQQQHQSHRQHHHQQQRFQLQHRHLPQLPQFANRNTVHYKMEQPLDLDPSDLTQQEAAARGFEPQFTGPLIGEKVSVQVVNEEFAGADPIFIAKLMTLPQTFPHYRAVRRDGNCGWRAIGFGYFEKLVQSGNLNLVQSELHRMTGLTEYIVKCGDQDLGIVELMVDETLTLYNAIIGDMSEGNDPMQTLTRKFNEDEISACVVYHLRLLVSARIKGNSANYAPYLPGPIDNYISDTVLGLNRDIDHPCIIALHDILLRPTNMVLNIAYLDRSEGTEVNMHMFPEEAMGQDPTTLGPIIDLLFRPDHYDILYRANQVHVSPVPAVPSPIDLQVHRASSFVSHQNFEQPVTAMQDASYAMDMGVLAMIPGLASSTLSPSSMTTDPFAPSPAPTWASQPFTPEAASAPLPSQPSPPQQQATVHLLRFSKYNFPSLHEMAPGSNSGHDPPCTTNTFKNSHFNTAHYNNLNFQPEMYQPDAEDEAAGNGHSKMGGRKRSTEHCPTIKKEK